MFRKILLPALFLVFAYFVISNNDIKVIVAGVAIFLVGMFFMEDGFKLFSGSLLEKLLEKFKEIQIAIINKCNTFKDLKPAVLDVVNQKYYSLRLIKEKDIAKQALAIEAASKINSEILYLLQCEITAEIFTFFI